MLVESGIGASRKSTESSTSGGDYAETLFMQDRCTWSDMTSRYSTHSGHRRLFRCFKEIASGPVGGPGMALAWSYQYFLLSFTESRMLRGLIRAIARITSFHLKMVDRYSLI